MDRTEAQQTGEVSEVAGRIRTIKPEWLEDEKMVLMSPAARVLSVGLILIADDHGRGVGHRGLIVSRVFPMHLDEGNAAYDELLSSGFFELYEVRGQTYFMITNWARHQRVDKPGKPRVPEPLGNIPGTLAKVIESLAPDHDHERDHETDHDTRPDARAHVGDAENEKSQNGPKQPKASSPHLGSTEASNGQENPYSPPLRANGKQVDDGRFIPELDDRTRANIRRCQMLFAEQNALRLALSSEGVSGYRGLGDAVGVEYFQRVGLMSAVENYSDEDLRHVLQVLAAECRKTRSMKWLNGTSNWGPKVIDRRRGVTVEAFVADDVKPKKKEPIPASHVKLNLRSEP